MRRRIGPDASPSPPRTSQVNASSLHQSGISRPCSMPAGTRAGGRVQDPSLSLMPEYSLPPPSGHSGSRAWCAVPENADARRRDWRVIQIKGPPHG